MTLSGTLTSVDLPMGDARWGEALPVLRELRPHLTEDLLHDVLSHPAAPSFSALFAADGRCVSVAGWRVMPTTANPSGRRLHVDDLVTSRIHRGHGHGAALLALLEERAAAAGCGFIELDSGVQRTLAHAFYHRHGMSVTCQHFGKQIDTGD